MTSETTPKPTTREELQEALEGTVAPGPSGRIYRVRALNLERHALSGGLPQRLRLVAMRGADAVREQLKASDEDVAEHGQPLKEYLDKIVCEVILEPALEPADIEAGLLHPSDWNWALNIALGEESRDGEGRRLWGREPLSAWDTFRHFHGCPEGCEGCAGMVRSLAPVLGGSA